MVPTSNCLGLYTPARGMACFPPVGCFCAPDGFFAPVCAQREPRSRLTPFRAPSKVEEVPMGLQKVQIGQLWKNDANGETYLVTRIYSEALSTVAVLRKSGAEQESFVRVRIERRGEGQTLPGYSPATQDEKF